MALPSQPKTHSGAQGNKQKGSNQKPPAQANFANVGSAYVAIDPSYPSFGFSFAVVGSISGTPGAVAAVTPAATETPALQLGTSPSERRQVR